MIPTGALRGIAYLAASMLFILSLRGLSTQESARRGNAFGTLGMLIAVLVTAVALLLPGPSATGGGELAPNSLTSLGVLGAALGSAVSSAALLAARVAMTSMPELVAMLHSFVGAAAVLVGIATYLQPGAEIAAAPTVHRTEIFIGVLVGAVTFTGSIVAFGKLRGIVGSKPLLLPGRHAAQPDHAARRASCWARCSCARPRPIVDGGGLFDGGLAPLLVMTAIALRPRRAPGHGDRRRRHAGRRVAAQQLLGLGGGRGRVHAVERPADHHRRAWSAAAARSSATSCAAR